MNDNLIEITCKNIKWSSLIKDRTFYYHISGDYYSKYNCRKNLPELVTVYINEEIPVFSKHLFKVLNIIQLSNKDLLKFISNEITYKTQWLHNGFEIKEVIFKYNDKLSLSLKRNIETKLGLFSI